MNRVEEYKEMLEAIKLEVEKLEEAIIDFEEEPDEDKPWSHVDFGMFLSNVQDIIEN
jgi:hypothetical protein